MSNQTPEPKEDFWREWRWENLKRAWKHDYRMKRIVIVALAFGCPLYLGALGQVLWQLVTR